MSETPFKESDTHIEQSFIADDIEQFAILTFTSVNESDSKTYTCQAENTYERESQVFDVEVILEGISTTELTDDTTIDFIESTTEETTETDSSTSELTDWTDEQTTFSSRTTEQASSTIVTSTSSLTTSTPTTLSTITPFPSTTTTTLKPPGSGKVYTMCELAEQLTYLFQDVYDWNMDIEKWLCLAKITTSFNASHVGFSLCDTLVYYGIFKQ
ncbi:cell wall integrity and stress response component 4-like [Folsomia candida]|uniref:cell wall integrity and stress response component 4-like n=1 Tax=Folsomia candida TaxID=158441 RepID=UPI001604FE49|nr:cell wall integrity and stress response component 4-like [Folsomia candida]